MEELEALAKAIRDQEDFSDGNFWRGTYNPLLEKLREKIKALEEDRKWRREMENEAMKALLNFKR